MVEPGLLVVSGLGAGAALIAGVRTRRPSSRPAARLDPADVGLREFPARGAFVQYSTPATILVDLLTDQPVQRADALRVIGSAAVDGTARARGAGTGAGRLGAGAELVDAL